MPVQKNAMSPVLMAAAVLACVVAIITIWAITAAAEVLTPLAFGVGTSGHYPGVVVFVAARPRFSLLVVGDSVAVGVGGNSPLGSLAGLLFRHLRDTTVVQVARCGARVDHIPLFARVASESSAAAVPGQRFDGVVLVISGNDVIRGTPSADYAKSLATAYTALAPLRRAAASPLVHVAMPVADEVPAMRQSAFLRLFRARARCLSQVTQQVADSAGVHVIFPDRLASESTLKSTLESTAPPGRGEAWQRLQAAGVLFSADGLHPSPGGYRVIAGCVLETLLPLAPALSPRSSVHAHRKALPAAWQTLHRDETSR
jgi:lysophospholipase L1-like esterase